MPRPRRWVRVFEAEVSASAKALGLYYEKRPVAQTGMGAIKLKSDRPDGFLICGGLHVHLEMKGQEMHGSLAIDRVSPEQENGWEALSLAGAPGFLLVNMRKKKKPGGGTAPSIAAWAMPCALWGHLKAELLDIGRKSIPYEWFLDPLRFAEIPRLPRDRGRRLGCWDLRTGLGNAAKLLARPVATGLIPPDLPTMLSLALADRDFQKEVQADLMTLCLGE